MNGLDDLRRTLDDQATDLVDHGMGARSASVHHRVTVRRRRRRAVVASGVAAAVAVAAAVTLTLDRGTADRRAEVASVVGVVVPAELTSLGYTYAFDRGVEGQDGTVVLRLTAVEQPRLVSWATSGDDQAVTVDGPALAGPTGFETTDFGDFTYVPGGTPYTVKVTADRGQPGLAVYTLTDERPAGVTRGGVTYRQEIAGGSLLGATIGGIGQGAVEVRASAAGPGTSVRYFCSGGPAGAYVHLDYLDTAQGGFGSGGCDDHVPVDAAIVGALGTTTALGDDVSLRLYVTAGPDGPRIESPDLRLGLGVYGLDQDPVGPGGAVPATLEDGGHVWTRVDLARSAPGQQRVSATAPGGRGPVLAVVFSTGAADFDVMIRARLGRSSAIGIGGGGSTQQLIAAGSTTSAWVESGTVEPGQTFGLAFYVEAG